ncbi:MAG: RluA family pseudouridine synthase [Patescibacteria group bacterium]|nr:RluA family pseudouridine synthase [Patescibacteria group bacterium]
MNYKIAEANNGDRLDKFLTEKLKNQTRSQIQKLIKNGGVLVNGKTVNVHRFLRIDDEISFVEVTKIEPPIVKARPTVMLEPKIIADEIDFLIVEKPAGLLVHATNQAEKNTLVSWLLKKYPEIAGVGEEKNRDGIIHRLDRDVSGVMAIAKNQAAYDHLKKQFKDRQVKKEYLALVYGRLPQTQGEIDLPIGRNKDGQFVAHPWRHQLKLDAKDKVAKTKYKVLEYLKDYSLLEVTILTGRTHQIRAHLSAIGHPILGDQIYKPKREIFNFLRRRIKVVDPGRIFLHSQKIGFNDLTNNWQEFTAPLPKILNDFLNEKRS